MKNTNLTELDGTASLIGQIVQVTENAEDGISQYNGMVGTVTGIVGYFSDGQPNYEVTLFTKKRISRSADQLTLIA